MATVPDESREHKLVDTVIDRILAVSNNEAKLTALLDKYLAPLLLKAESPHASVREKVIGFCKPLKTFTQPPAVKLPVGALLEQYHKTASPILRALDMSFIQAGIDRLEPDTRKTLVPKALTGIHKDAGSSTAPSLFNVFLRIFSNLDVPSRGSPAEAGFRERVGLADEEDARYVARWLGCVILLKMPGTANARTLQAANPGIKQEELDFLRPERPESSQVYANMPELRRRAVRFLASAAFHDKERFIPSLFAAASSDGEVSSIGIDMIKRSDVSLEDADLVSLLFSVHLRMPADVRIRILERLSRSEIATTMDAHILEVIKLDFIAPASESAQDTRAHLRPTSSLERVKLHKAVLQFLTWVGRVGPSEGDFAVGPELITQMIDFVEATGWPRPARLPLTADEKVLRGMAYETIGTIARGSKLSPRRFFDLFVFLFRALSEDPVSEVVVNIDASLASLPRVFKIDEMGDELVGALRTTLLQYMLKDDDQAPAVRSARHMAVKWANTCLPFSDPIARWIDILAVAGRANERSDVVDEGKKGLDPWTYYAHVEGDERPELPPWEELIRIIFDRRIPTELTPPTGLDAHDDTFDENRFINFPGESIAAFPVALDYCKKLMLLSGIYDFEFAPDWTRDLEAKIKTENAIRDKIRHYLDQAAGSGDLMPVMILLRSCLDGMFHDNTKILEECALIFVDVASLAPRRVIGVVAERAPELLPLLRHHKPEIRVLVARAFGILAPHPSNSDELARKWSEQLLEVTDAWESSNGLLQGPLEGALLAYAHFVSRSVYYGRHDLVKDVRFPVKILTKEGASKSLLDTTLDCLVQLWTASLAVPEDNSPVTTTQIIDALASLAKKSNEKAISALGRLGLALRYPQSAPPDADAMETSEPWNVGHTGRILTELFKLHEIKHAEVHFTVGEAITAIVACWDSDHVVLSLDVDAAPGGYRTSKRSDLIASVLDKLFADAKQTKPSLLKAAGIWLFCLVQYCGQLPEVKARLRQSQVSFMRLLNSRDSLVQETAARGLTLVYEKGEDALRDELVRDMVATFTGTGPQLKVDEDTELFDAGALPTGEGRSIVSYKDIVSLANEVGDPSLVYRFMNLATNAATWNARSAFGRFGLGRIIGGKELEPKVYAKLFRFRFDPNPNVQKSMNDIWTAIVRDPQTVISEQFDSIMADLLTSILGREWRMREASCAAIADLVQGQPFPKYTHYYSEIWTKAIKVLDDVKGSVRAAALKLCMGLANTIVRLLEESADLAGTQAMLKEALPFLLSTQGMESNVEDVKLFCTMTVLKIAKGGGKALKPFIPDMVAQLLGLLSTIEPEAINYHYQRLGEDNREKLDQARASFVNRSPISEAIDNCLRQVDAETMAGLAPRLEATIKSAIGMPTKIGCSKVLATLFTRHQHDIAPFAPRFLRMMEKQILDRNDSVSRAYARSAAYMMRTAPDSAREHFCARLVDLYYSPDNAEFLRQKTADAVVALSHVSPDHFSALEARLLPFAYLGAHDTDDYTQTEFKAVWEQQAGSGSRTVARYVPEIVALVERALATAQWALQHTAALTLAAMVPAVGAASDASGGQISEANLKALWPVLEKALALKTFAGKEKLLDAFPEFVSKGRALWAADTAVAAQLRKIAVREAKRNNDAYRVHALRALWRFAEARDDLDMATEIRDIVLPFLDDFRDEGKMELDAKEDTTTKIVENAIEAVARGYSRPLMKKDSLAVLKGVMETLGPYLRHDKFGGLRRVVWYACVADLMDAATKSMDESKSEGEVALTYLMSVDVEHAESGTEKQRLQRAKAVLAVVKAYARGVFGSADGKDVKARMSEMVDKMLAGERSLDVQKALKEVVSELK